MKTERFCGELDLSTLCKTLETKKIHPVTDFTKDSNSYRDHNIQFSVHYVENQPKRRTNYVKEFDFQYLDKTEKWFS